MTMQPTVALLFALTLSLFALPFALPLQAAFSPFFFGGFFDDKSCWIFRKALRVVMRVPAAFVVLPVASLGRDKSE